MIELVIIGAGGFGRETAEAVRAANRLRPTWDLLGFLDDDPGLGTTTVDGLRVMGTTDALVDLPDAQVVVCAGGPGTSFVRRRLVERLALDETRYATVVHPSAVLPPAVVLGRGTVVLAGTVATTGVHVGAHVVLMPGVVLTHDDVLGNYVTCASRACLAGCVRVDEGAYLGAGALVREHRTVGAWSVIGMGSVVVADVPAGEVWAGVPARWLRKADRPPESGTGDREVGPA